jgi:hypothetical protein
VSELQECLDDATETAQTTAKLLKTSQANQETVVEESKKLHNAYLELEENSKNQKYFFSLFLFFTSLLFRLFPRGTELRGKMNAAK